MGYVSVIAPCIRCGQPFMFSPTKVPSIVIDGTREPLCASCVVAINEVRVGLGHDPIVPSPDAYLGDDENDVDWGES